MPLKLACVNFSLRGKAGVPLHREDLKTLFMANLGLGSDFFLQSLHVDASSPIFQLEIGN